MAQNTRTFITTVMFHFELRLSRTRMKHILRLFPRSLVFKSPRVRSAISRRTEHQYVMYDSLVRPYRRPAVCCVPL